MRLLAFTSRNRKELLRGPWNLAFGIGFPLVLLLLLSAIQANIPVSLFTVEKLAPGLAVFVMPEVARSFYADMKYGLKYFTYVTEELPNICKTVFRISAKHDRAMSRRSRSCMVSSTAVKPKTYCPCGTEDDLHGDNVRFRDEIAKLDLDFVYEEWPGVHDWTFFNESYRRALKRCFGSSSEPSSRTGPGRETTGKNPSWGV